MKIWSLPPSIFLEVSNWMPFCIWIRKTNHPPSETSVTPLKNANDGASCLRSTSPPIAMEGSHCIHDPDRLKLRFLKGVFSRLIENFGLNAYELGKESFPYIHGVIDLYTDDKNAVIYMDGKEPFLQPLLCAGETGDVHVTMGGQGLLRSPICCVYLIDTCQPCVPQHTFRG